ncbi:unnamed protein product [Cunninghamella blakesleeana]
MKSLLNADQALARQLQKEFNEQIINMNKDVFQQTISTIPPSSPTINPYKEIIVLNDKNDSNNDMLPSTSNNDSNKQSNQLIIEIKEDDEKEFDADYLFALKIQEEEYSKNIGKGKEKENKNIITSPSSTSVCTNVVADDEYDPNPDIIELFLAFNDMYFDGKLGMVEIKWSKRMTVCAGLCKYQFGGLCSISLSEPLLKFRPRSDMVNTLLHEMIHAYLFVTMQFSNRESHGPEFLREAERINERAGTQITIFHSFNDEVKYYKTHVWRCDGPCRDRPPYHGYVSRSMNRPPQKADSWFATHQKICGGEFKKIKSPPEKPKTTCSKKDKNIKSNMKDKEQSNKMTKYLLTDDDNDIFNTLESSSSPKKKKRME